VAAPGGDPLAAAACATIPLTPEQSAGLKDAQRFADEVTTAYRVTAVKVIAYEGSIRPGISWGRYLSVGTPDLAGSDVREKIALPLAGATLDYIPSSRTAVTHRTAWRRGSRWSRRGTRGTSPKDEASPYVGGVTRAWLKLKQPGWSRGGPVAATRVGKLFPVWSEYRRMV
jgi:hypothetical protein